MCKSFSKSLYLLVFKKFKCELELKTEYLYIGFFTFIFSEIFMFFNVYKIVTKFAKTGKNMFFFVPAQKIPNFKLLTIITDYPNHNLVIEFDLFHTLDKVIKIKLYLFIIESYFQKAVIRFMKDLTVFYSSYMLL